MPKEYTIHKKWEGTPVGEALQEIRRLHASLAGQPAREQEVTRQGIERLERELWHAGVYGKYDPYLGRFVEDSPGKQRRK